MRLTTRVALYLGIGGLSSVGCQKQDLDPSSNIQEAGSASSILGSWKDESQLILVMRDGNEVIKTLERSTTAEAYIDNLGADRNSIVDWMVLDSRRTFSQSKYSLDAACRTRGGLKSALSVHAAITLSEGTRSFSINSEEQTSAEKIGSFTCEAYLPSKTTRRYRIEQDGQGSVLVLELGNGELRSFRDRKSDVPDSPTSVTAKEGAWTKQTCKNKEPVNFSKGWTTDYRLSLDPSKGADGWTISVTAKGINSTKAVDWGTHAVELAIGDLPSAKFQTFTENDARILIHRPEGQEPLRIPMSCQQQ
jgi:hypothetical protein